MALRQLRRRFVLIDQSHAEAAPSAASSSSCGYGISSGVQEEVQSQSLKRSLDVVIPCTSRNKSSSTHRAALVSPLLVDDCVDANTDVPVLPCIPDFEDDGESPEYSKDEHQKQTNNHFRIVIPGSAGGSKFGAAHGTSLREASTKQQDDQVTIKAAASALLLIKYFPVSDPSTSIVKVEPANAASTICNAVVNQPTTSTVIRLTLPEDHLELNSHHCFVRSHLLELFVDQDDTASEGGGRVGLRCVYCKHIPRRDRAGLIMSAFYPKSLNDIYRSVCTWQRVHFQTCQCVPQDVRRAYETMKTEDKSRGKTIYWRESAKRIGLVDIGGVEGEREGIRFRNLPTI